MKKKIRLLSVLSAVVIGTTMGLTACGGGGVEEHDHTWNDGEITQEATCQVEGVKTYTCTVEGCEQTKTEPVTKKAHSWNGGEVTEEPKCNKDGIKTFTCTNEGCAQTKTEPIDKTDHRYDEGKVTKTPDFLTTGKKTFTCLDCEVEKVESVAAHADFAEQFYTNLIERTGWEYGYANSYDKDSGAVDFVRIEQTDAQNGSWKADGTEISKGYVYSENHTVIAYRFADEVPEKIQSNLAISFNGEESTSALKAHLMLTDGNGGLKEVEELNKAGAKDWSYQSEEAIDVAQGDTFWLIFDNAGSGKAGGSLSFTLTAPCVHVWNAGTVKEAATCKKEGVMDYSCLNCGAKREGVIEKTDHTWNGGVVTKEATETEEGIKTYTCTVCEGTREEYIPRLGSSEFNGADYATDFSTVAQPNWKFGYTNNFDFGNNTFKFNELKPYGEAWVDNGGIEIKSGWLRNETDGAQSIVRYIMPQTREINISLSFKGSDSVTRMTGRLHILKPDGTVQLCDFIDGTQSDQWDFNKERVTVEKGSAISVIFFNEGNGGYYHGSFSMKLTAESQQPAPEFNGANFAEDFAATLKGESNWEVGKVDYDFPTESFTFTKITSLNGAGDALNLGEPWIEVKGDWMASNGMMGFAYRFTSAASVAVDFNLHGVADGSKFSLRWAIKDKAGNIKNQDGKAQWGTEGRDIAFKQDITVVEGDVLYLLINKESDSDQSTFGITLTSKN